jgi:restriction endonuclease Mrr
MGDEAKRLTETYVLVLNVLFRETEPKTAFAIGCNAFKYIGRTTGYAATEWASRRLAKLRDLGLVDQVRRGFWQITQQGRDFITGKDTA